MSKEAIKDERFHIIGYIETMPDGKQKAEDAKFHIIGHYDPKTNVTTDERFHTIGHGNMLSALNLQKR